MVYRIMNLMIIRISILVIFSVLVFSGCNERIDESLKLKEKELDLKQQEIDLEKKKLESQNQNEEYSKKLIDNNIDLEGLWIGTIKDGTYWTIEIRNFDGTNFIGVNNIYWKKYPEGYKTNFSGTLNSNKEIIMYEDRNTKGSGKFVGNVSNDGKFMSGEWYRYTDNGTFNWSLKK